MPPFFKKTSVKIIGAVLCVLCLAVGIFFGLISMNVALSRWIFQPNRTLQQYD